MPMIDPVSSIQVIEKFFRWHPLADLEKLSQILDTTSRADFLAMSISLPAAEEQIAKKITTINRYSEYDLIFL